MNLVEAYNDDRENRLLAKRAYNYAYKYLKNNAQRLYTSINKNIENLKDGKNGLKIPMHNIIMGKYGDLSLILTSDHHRDNFLAGFGRYSETQKQIIMPILNLNELTPNSIHENFKWEKLHFLHEFIHYLDDKRLKDKSSYLGYIASKKEKNTSNYKDYLNDPMEFNAYYQQGVENFWDSFNAQYKRSYFKKIMNLSYQDFLKENLFNLIFPKYNKLNGKMKKHFQKRFYPVWQKAQEKFRR